MNQQGRKWATGLARMIDPDYQGDIGMLSHNESKEENI